MALLNRDAWARSILSKVWTDAYGTAPFLVRPTTPALQAVQAIARLESGGGYGAAGTSDPIWQGSNNWGAIKCASSGRPPCPEGCFEHTDSDEHGQAGIYCFRKFASPEDGARGILRELLRRPAVQRVMENPSSATAIANAMKAPPAYMGLPAAAYARLIAQRAAQVAKNLGEPVFVTLTGPSSSGGFGELAISLLVGLAIADAFKRRRR